MGVCSVFLSDLLIARFGCDHAAYGNLIFEYKSLVSENPHQFKQVYPITENTDLCIPIDSDQVHFTLFCFLFVCLFFFVCLFCFVFFFLIVCVCVCVFVFVICVGVCAWCIYYYFCLYVFLFLLLCFSLFVCFVFVCLFCFFVSPELSSGRDLVIQMSVRRVPSAVHGFLSGAYLGNRMTYLDDIWYLVGLGLKVVHAEFWVWQMHIKCLICIIYA